MKKFLNGGGFLKRHEEVSNKRSFEEPRVKDKDENIWETR